MAISGLSAVLPIIGSSLMSYPPLADQYYTLLNSLFEIYIEKGMIEIFLVFEVETDHR